MFQGNLNFQGGRGIHVLGAVGVRVGVGVDIIILILKETYNTCNFRGWGVVIRISPPPPLYGFVTQTVKKGCKVVISNSVNVMLWAKFKYNKGQ